MSRTELLSELRVNIHHDLELQLAAHHHLSVLGLQKLLNSCLICWTIDRPFGQQRVRENLPIIFVDVIVQLVPTSKMHFIA